jgi:hypothetical protein
MEAAIFFKIPYNFEEAKESSFSAIDIYTVGKICEFSVSQNGVSEDSNLLEVYTILSA